MKYGWWLLGLSSACLAVGCSSSGSGAAGGIPDADAAAFVGIYQETSYTENMAGCDAPGAPVILNSGPMGPDSFFLVVGLTELGVHTLVIVSCSDVTDCQTKRTAVTSGAFYSSAYSFTLSAAANATTVTGFEASSGFGNGTTCTGRTYSEHALRLNADHSLHLESRTKDLPDQPQQGGFCEVEAAQAKQQAEPLRCSDLKMLDGSFVQAM